MLEVNKMDGNEPVTLQCTGKWSGHVVLQSDQATIAELKEAVAKSSGTTERVTVE